MNEILLNAVQKQINSEFYSSYLYFSMSSWCERNNLKGFANWFRVQAQEELFHGMFMHDYLIRRGLTSIMDTISKPMSGWKDIKEVFEHVCSHERNVTTSINNLASIALQDFDHSAYQFILWYVDEQVEEEESCSEILERLKFSQLKPEYIYALDAELGNRVYRQPSVKQN